MKRFLRDWLPILAVMLFTRAALADHYVVPTGSMEPTVQVGDHVFVDKRAYGLRIPVTHVYITRHAAPAPGEVVVLDSPTDNRVLLKRVVASEGMEVSVRNGHVSLNGMVQPITQGLEQLGAHAHPLSLWPSGGPDFGPAVVPPGKTLVMGDNRGNSYDGRSFGFVDNDAILGRARKVCWHDGSLAWNDLD